MKANERSAKDGAQAKSHKNGAQRRALTRANAGKTALPGSAQAVAALNEHVARAQRTGPDLHEPRVQVVLPRYRRSRRESTHTRNG